MTGCVDHTNVEDVSMTLVLGIDLDKDDNLMVYMLSPVFAEEAKEKDEINFVKSVTVRSSRDLFDSTVMGLTTGSKTQVIFVGKRLLEQKHWADYLDPFLRDPKNTVTSRIVGVEGPVSDVFLYKPKDKARLPVYYTKLIDSAYRRNITVKTNLQEFYKQILEKGMTPTISAIKKTDKVYVNGSVLLDEEDKYVLTITPYENKLLRILQHENNGDYPFTIELPSISNKVDKPFISFYTQNTKVKTKVGKEDNNFKFDINVKMRIAFTERLFSYNVRKAPEKLQKSIETKLQEDFENLIKKIQSSKIDPIGLGLYARANMYQDYKEVQNQWGKTLSKANINVKVHVKIGGMGTIK